MTADNWKKVGISAGVGGICGAVGGGAGAIGATAAGAYDAKLGRVTASFSGDIPDKVSGSLLKRANRIGGIGSKGLTPSNTVGCCAEFRSANTLMLRGSRINNIRFTDAVRPRTGDTIPACKNCTSIFKEAFR